MRPVGEQDSTHAYPWRILWLLLLVAVLAGVGALPYILTVFRGKLTDSAGLPKSLPLLFVVQALQFTFIFGLVIGAGLFLGRRVGIRTPLLDAWIYEKRALRSFSVVRTVVIGLVLGVIGTLFIYGFVVPRAPEWPSGAELPVWMRLLAAFYSGVDDELLTRLFLLALLLWIAQKLRAGQTASGAVFWTANTIVALIFAAAYLPGAAALVPLTQGIVLSILVSNGIAGLVFGWLCWRDGLEAAMLAHFSANLVMHFAGPLLHGG